jgi:hypothetical protein
MPPSRRQVAAVGGWKIGQTRKDPKQRDTTGRSGRLVEQEIDSEDARSEAVDDILARSPPPDKPENRSKATKKIGMFRASLLSGSIHEERDLITQELAAAGRYVCRELYHPGTSRLVSMTRAISTECTSLKGKNQGGKLVIAGIPDEPMNLDPPRASGPFDALKYPEALIARLNPVPNDPDGLPHGWSDEALKNVPRHILSPTSPWRH